MDVVAYSVKSIIFVSLRGNQLSKSQHVICPLIRCCKIDILNWMELNSKMLNHVCDTSDRLNHQCMLQMRTRSFKSPSLTCLTKSHTQQQPYKLKCTREKKKSEQTNKSILMTRRRVGGHESAEHKPTPPRSFQRFLLDRKMDGPNSINNHTPLTMTPKLLTLQLPPDAIARKTTSHNVAHISPDRNKHCVRQQCSERVLEICNLSSPSPQDREPRGCWRGHLGRSAWCAD